MDHLLVQSFWFDSSQCYFPIGTKHFLSDFAQNTGFCNSLIQGSQGILKCQYVAGVSRYGPLSCPFAPCGPSLQLAMWLWMVKINKVTLCKMSKLYTGSTLDLNQCSGQSQYATIWLPVHTRVQY